MKKLFSLLAVVVITLTCGVLFTACFGGGDRKGQKCYISLDIDNGSPFNYKGIHIEYGTTYDGIDNWMGADDFDEATQTQRHWFIKGDVIHFKAYCDSQYFYADSDLKLVINGEPIDMEERVEQFNGTAEEIYCLACDYTVNEDITVGFANLKERSANITLKAKNKSQLVSEIRDFVEIVDDYALSDYFYMDDSTIFVRFEDKDVFGLDKAEWGINELREYLSAHNIVGENIGASTGTNIYIYSKGYNIACPRSFTEASLIDWEEGVESRPWISVHTDSYCYINEEKNEFGYKFNLRPADTYLSDVMNGTVSADEVDVNAYKDGTAALLTNRDMVRENEIYGSMPPIITNDGYQFSASIDEVGRINPVFSIRYGDQPVGGAMDVSDFSADGKLNVYINLKKYSESSWKMLYDKMQIQVSDVVLKKGTDYTISSSGLLSLQLDRPYKYFKLDAHGECPEYFSGEILSEYMYTYFLYFDIIEMAKDAGLVTAIDHIMYNPDCIKITREEENNGFVDVELPGDYYGCVFAFMDKETANPKALVLSTGEHLGDIWAKENYSKVRFTYGDGKSFTVNIKSASINASTQTDHSEMMNILEEASYASGQNAVVLRFTPVEEGNYFGYFFKVKAALNISKIEFLL